MYITQIKLSFLLTGTRHQAIPEEKVLHRSCPVEGSRVSVIDSEGQRIGDVIVKIFTYARQIVNNGDTDGIQVFSRTDTAVQKYLRRINRACV